MKRTSVRSYEQIAKRAPTIHYWVLTAIQNFGKSITQHEIDAAVAVLRGKANGYSSARSRVWELETAGLVYDTGEERRVKTKNLSVCYALTKEGIALMQKPESDVKYALYLMNRAIMKGREAREMETNPINAKHRAYMAAETRAIIAKALA